MGPSLDPPFIVQGLSVSVTLDLLSGCVVSVMVSLVVVSCLCDV
jgi:hypothetical protein